jgi:hypothetical protein
MRPASAGDRFRGVTTGVFHPLDQAVAAAGFVAGGAAAAAATVLVVRRLGGGFETAPGGLAWIVAASGIALVAAADATARRYGGLLGPLAARIGLIAGVASITIPPRSGDWPAIIALLASAAVAVVPPPRSAGDRERREPAARRGRRLEAPVGGRPQEPKPPAVPGRLVQRLERYEAADGRDCLRGRVCLSLAAGSRGTHAHVGFCPAFAATPTVSVSTEYDGVEAVVTAAEILPWGVRIDCRLSEPADEPLEIPVDVAAQAAR